MTKTIIRRAFIGYDKSEVLMKLEGINSLAEDVRGNLVSKTQALAQAQQMLIDGEAAFYKLPLDVRQQFNNDFRNWLFTSGQPEWVEKMSKLITTDDVNKETKESAPAESEVKE